MTPTNFRRAVKAADQVGCDFILGSVRGGAEVTQLQLRLLLVDLHRDPIELGDGAQLQSTYQYVVGLDVCMHDVTFPQKAQRKQELLRVCAYSPNI